MFITSHTNGRASHFIWQDCLFKCSISLQTNSLALASKPPCLLSFPFYFFFPLLHTSLNVSRLAVMVCVLEVFHAS